MRMKRLSTLLFIGALLFFPSPGMAFDPFDLQLDILPSPNPGGPLFIDRLELVFNNHQGTITVAEKGTIKANAIIHYTGNGALAGKWLVDGRPIQTFNQTLTFGSTLTLTTGDIPPLPTFEPGRHTVTLALTSPVVFFKIPVIVYTVARNASSGNETIALLFPPDKKEIFKPHRSSLRLSANTASGQPSDHTSGDIQFIWKKDAAPLRANHTFMIEIYKGAPVGAPVISALVQRPFYILSRLLSSSLEAGADYAWLVRELDGKGREAAVSHPQTFRLKTDGIELVSPEWDEAVKLPAHFSWKSGEAHARYEVRIYPNDEAMKRDLGGGLSLPNVKPLLVISLNNESGSDYTLTPNIAAPLSPPGLLLSWVVVGLDAQGKVRSVSDGGRFRVAAPLLPNQKRSSLDPQSEKLK